MSMPPLATPQFSSGDRVDRLDHLIPREGRPVMDLIPCEDKMEAHDRINVPAEELTSQSCHPGISLPLSDPLHGYRSPFRE